MGAIKTITDLRTETEVTDAYINIQGFANGTPVFQARKIKDMSDNLVITSWNLLDNATPEQKAAYEDDLKALAYKHLKLITQVINDEEKTFTNDDDEDLEEELIIK